MDVFSDSPKEENTITIAIKGNSNAKDDGLKLQVEKEIDLEDKILTLEDAEEQQVLQTQIEELVDASLKVKGRQIRQKRKRGQS